MRRFGSPSVLVVLLLCLTNCLNATTDRPHSLLRCRIRLLATSTSVRVDMGRNEDVYLAALSWQHPKQHSDVTLARLVDDYPGYRSGILDSIRVSTNATFRVERDPSCDRALALIPIRTAPGDPRAVLPERLGYSVPVPLAVTSTGILPCYRVVR